MIHAFQKKSKSGVKTPQAEIEVIRERLKRLKEALNLDYALRVGGCGVNS